ncbi:UNVERIFIED_CONTAM: Nucleolin 2 [Sesamum calycinum]|uniref:Nucleolin 2 n=1 Tax=Sesamum calycinum TaxID=2727403 RepID=A0AAW2QZV3_9LAMI
MGKSTKKSASKVKASAKNGHVGSDSEDESSGLEEAATAPKKPAIAAKNGHVAAVKRKDESSDDTDSSSEDETSSDEDVAAAKKAPVALTKKGPVAPAKKKDESTDDSDSSSEDETSSDEDVTAAKKAPATKKKSVVSTPKKDESSSDESDSEDETSSDDNAAKTKKAPAASTKNGPVAATGKKKDESSTDDSSDDDVAAKNNTAAVSKKKDESSEESESDNEGSGSDDDDDTDVKMTDVPTAKANAGKGGSPSEKTAPKAAPLKRATADKKQAKKESSSDDDSSEESDDEEPQSKKIKVPGTDVEMTDVKTGKGNAAKGGSPFEKTPKTPATPKEQTTGSKTLFVGNLSFSVEQADVENFFKSAGEVVDVRFAMDADNQFRGFGHVEFASAEAAEKALRELNGEDLLGRAVRLDLARERGSYTPYSGGKDTPSFQKEGELRGKRYLFVDLTNMMVKIRFRSSLEEHFGSCGEIARVSIPTDQDGGVKGMAYIEFKDSNAFNQALELNGSELGDGTLQVDEAKPRGDSAGGGRGGGGRSGGRGGGRDFGGRGGGRRGGGRGGGGRFGGGRGRGTPSRPSMAAAGTDLLSIYWYRKEDNIRRLSSGRRGTLASAGRLSVAKVLGLLFKLC